MKAHATNDNEQCAYFPRQEKILHKRNVFWISEAIIIQTKNGVAFF